MTKKISEQNIKTIGDHRHFYLFSIAQDQRSLALFELQQLLHINILHDWGKYLFCASKEPLRKYLYSRLAYTNEIYELILQADSFEQILEKLPSLDKDILGDSFAVRAVILSSQEQEGSDAKALAGTIGHVIKKHTALPVKLKDPYTLFFYVQTDTGAFVTRHLWQNDKAFFERRAHLRPVLHPTSLHPRLARACVNALGPNITTVLDPFCGTAGILIEAGLMNLRCVGYDLSDQMLAAATKNLEHYAISSHITLEKKDAQLLFDDPLVTMAATSDEQVGIVTDLPYGKGTKLFDKNRQELFSSFLDLLLAKKIPAAIMLPHDHNISLQKYEQYIAHKETVYLHKSLSKEIIFLSFE